MIGETNSGDTVFFSYAMTAIIINDGVAREIRVYDLNDVLGIPKGYQGGECVSV